MGLWEVRDWDIGSDTAFFTVSHCIPGENWVFCRPSIEMQITEWLDILDRSGCMM